MPGKAFIWINGEVKDTNDATVAALDRGLLYGDGLFETMRSYRGRVFRLNAHLERLAASAGFLRLQLPYGIAELADAVRSLVDIARASMPADGDCYLRLTLTRGPHTGPLTLDTGQAPTVIIHAKELVDYPAEYRRDGMPVCIASIRRNEGSPLPRHKTLNYLDSLLAKAEAGDRGCAEALLLNNAGELAEGATSNLFWVRDNTVHTPAVEAGLLPGITRGTVIDLCRSLQMPLKEGLFGPEELRGADEIFLTNSLMELMPVRSIDGHAPGCDVPGAVTDLLLKAYRRQVEKEISADMA